MVTNLTVNVIILYDHVIHVLDPEDESDKKQQLFHTYSGLSDHAEKLNQHLTALKASLAATSSNQSDRLAML